MTQMDDATIEAEVQQRMRLEKNRAAVRHSLTVELPAVPRRAYIRHMGRVLVEMTTGDLFSGPEEARDGYEWWFDIVDGHDDRAKAMLLEQIVDAARAYAASRR